MRTELELIQKIEAWLDGSMSAEEQRLFEENMLRDAHLLGEVRLQQEIMNGIGTVKQTTLSKSFERSTALLISITSVTEYLLGLKGIILDRPPDRSCYH